MVFGERGLINRIMSRSIRIGDFSKDKNILPIFERTAPLARFLRRRSPFNQKFDLNDFIKKHPELGFSASDDKKGTYAVCVRDVRPWGELIRIVSNIETAGGIANQYYDNMRMLENMMQEARKNNYPTCVIGDRDYECVYITDDKNEADKLVRSFNMLVHSIEVVNLKEDVESGKIKLRYPVGYVPPNALTDPRMSELINKKVDTKYIAQFQGSESIDEAAENALEYFGIPRDTFMSDIKWKVCVVYIDTIETLVDSLHYMFMMSGITGEDDDDTIRMKLDNAIKSKSFSEIMFEEMKKIVSALKAIKENKALPAPLIMDTTPLSGAHTIVAYKLNGRNEIVAFKSDYTPKSKYVDKYISQLSQYDDISKLLQSTGSSETTDTALQQYSTDWPLVIVECPKCHRTIPITAHWKHYTCFGCGTFYIRGKEPHLKVVGYRYVKEYHPGTKRKSEDEVSKRELTLEEILSRRKRELEANEVIRARFGVYVKDKSWNIPEEASKLPPNAIYSILTGKASQRIIGGEKYFLVGIATPEMMEELKDKLEEVKPTIIVEKLTDEEYEKDIRPKGEKALDALELEELFVRGLPEKRSDGTKTTSLRKDTLVEDYTNVAKNLSKEGFDREKIIDVLIHTSRAIGLPVEVAFALVYNALKSIGQSESDISKREMTLGEQIRTYTGEYKARKALEANIGVYVKDQSWTIPEEASKIPLNTIFTILAGKAPSRIIRGEKYFLVGFTTPETMEKLKDSIEKVKPTVILEPMTKEEYDKYTKQYAENKTNELELEELFIRGLPERRSDGTSTTEMAKSDDMLTEDYINVARYLSKEGLDEDKIIDVLAHASHMFRIPNKTAAVLIYKALNSLERHESSTSEFDVEYFTTPEHISAWSSAYPDANILEQFSDSYGLWVIYELPTTGYSYARKKEGFPETLRAILRAKGVKMPADDPEGIKPETIWAGRLALRWAEAMWTSINRRPEEFEGIHTNRDELAAAMFFKLTQPTELDEETGEKVDARVIWKKKRVKGVKRYVQTTLNDYIAQIEKPEERRIEEYVPPAPPTTPPPAPPRVPPSAPPTIPAPPSALIALPPIPPEVGPEVPTAAPKAPPEEVPPEAPSRREKERRRPGRPPSKPSRALLRGRGKSEYEPDQFDELASMWIERFGSREPVEMAKMRIREHLRNKNYPERRLEYLRKYIESSGESPSYPALEKTISRIDEILEKGASEYNNDAIEYATNSWIKTFSKSNHDTNRKAVREFLVSNGFDDETLDWIAWFAQEVRNGVVPKKSTIPAHIVTTLERLGEIVPGGK